MLCIIGTYRGNKYLPRLMENLTNNLGGVTEYAFVDDSGSPQPWQYQRGHVFDVGRRGYNEAMKTVCRAATELAPGEPFFFIEEDFTLLAPVSLHQIEARLLTRPNLAQVALMRGPFFPIEVEHGGLLEGLKARLPDTKLELIGDVWEQDGTFTCNPSMWRPEVAESGWPDGKWSEDKKRDELLAEGWLFGILEGVVVEHDGVRSGFGY